MAEDSELARADGAPMPNWALAFESAAFGVAGTLTLALAWQLALGGAWLDFKALAVGLAVLLPVALCAWSAFHHVRTRRARSRRAYRRIATALCVFATLVAISATAALLSHLSGVGVVFAGAALAALALALALLERSAAPQSVAHFEFVERSSRGGAPAR